MDVTLGAAFEEACRIIGEQTVTDRLRSRMEQPTPAGPVLEDDGYKVYATPDPDCFVVSWGGQWLEGCWGATIEQALEKGRHAVESEQPE